MSTLHVSKLAAITEKAAAANEDAFEEASTATAYSLADGGLVHLYGSGHSGSNSSGIDTALYAKKRGLTVVAITAKANMDKPATHSSGKRLPHASDIVIDTGAPVEDAIVPIEGWSRPVSGSSTVLAMIMMHELVSRTAQKLAARGIELPVFASPTIPGVTLHDTDVIYGVYRERMIEAQRKHLPEFKRVMAGEG